MFKLKYGHTWSDALLIWALVTIPVALLTVGCILTYYNLDVVWKANTCCHTVYTQRICP